MRTMIFCLLVQASAMLLAQDRPITHQQFVWEPQIQDWILSRQIQYVYDERDSVQQRIYLIAGNPILPDEKDMEITHHYNAAGEEIFKLTRIRNLKEDWRNLRRETHLTHTAQGKVLLYESWKENEWQIKGRQRITKQVKEGESVQNTFYDWMLEDGTYWTRTQDSSILDEFGREIRGWEFVWNTPDGPRIAKTSREVIYADLGYPVYGRTEQLNASPPRFSEYRRRHEHDEEGRILEIEEERRSTFHPEWQVTNTQRYRYDEEGRTILKANYTYPGHVEVRYTFRADTLITTHYHDAYGLGLQAQNRSIRIPYREDYQYYNREEEWLDDRWQLEVEEYFQFTEDEYGNITEIKQQRDTPYGSFVGGYRRFARTYDEQGRILSESTYDYDRSAERYQPITKELWVYPLGEAASQNDFLLYPQPSQGEITIQLVRQSSPPQQVRVYDLSGRLIFSQVVQLAAHENRIEFALKQLPGLYTVQLEYEDGSSLSRKLLLE